MTDLGEALMMAERRFGRPASRWSCSGAPPRSIRHMCARATTSPAKRRALGDFEAAIDDWDALLALAKGDEPWVANAKAGLDAAEPASPPEHPARRRDGGPILPRSTPWSTGSRRGLNEEGGTIEEWTQLVRSRLVQGRMDEAQAGL